MKRLILSLCFLLFLLIFSWPAQARVKEIQFYQHEVLVLEEFPLKAGTNILMLAREVSPREISFKASSGVKILSLSLERGSKKDPLTLKIQEIRKKLETLNEELQIINQEISLIEEALKGKREVPSPQVFERYHKQWKNLTTKKLSKEKGIKALKKRLKELESQIISFNTSVLKVIAEGDGFLEVRYPARKLISWQESYDCFLNTRSRELTIKAQALITQKSGLSWEKITLAFYPRGETFAVLSPPPFSPWIIDDFPPRPKPLLHKAVEAVKDLSAEVKREEAPGGVWERIIIQGINLPSGSPTAVTLEEETLKTEKILLEVPLYAVSKAFFRADLIPDKSFPRLKARFYLDDALVGKGNIGPLNPGIKSHLYFGQAPLLEVKREVLKDIKGDSLFGKKTRLRELKTQLTNHYKRPFEIEVIDRVPVSRKKEVKIKAYANPPWAEKHPDGKVIWRFKLAPQERQEIFFKIEIKRPKDE
ncbi:DUF4139 domain-containing protein [Thermodesulfatator autotrophicus]|uniref:DUF4139 domain-containing protein n=1 Tax=Thermodesulfatator autotrophicus TaxID=1795632 RepID=A0A177E972_9BACT|nr:DUF4139 domain-containing protein [Thermodesulfatator autotrophicus]OAG28503.1 hypothetical protein TH606_01350 [Thermodesulfatator autotrophicus]